MASNITLLDLRNACKDRADMQNSNFITDDEWNRYINSAAKELYEILILKGLQYTTTTDTISLNGTDDTYDLPSNFFKLVGVDHNINNETYPMEEYTFQNRNLYNQQNTQRYLRYRLVGEDMIRFNPKPSAQEITIWYDPVLATLSDDTDTLNGVNGWEEYVIVRSALWAKIKEESETGDLKQDIVFLRDRIETAAENRDLGPAGQVTDVRRDRRRRWEF